MKDLTKNNLEGIEFVLSNNNTQISYLKYGYKYTIGKKSKMNILEMNSPSCYPIYFGGELVCKRRCSNILNNFKNGLFSFYTKPPWLF